MSDEEIKAAQAWQLHRQECVKLAIKAGASMADVIDLAAKISAFIVTKSDLEKAVKSS